jgi:hypothetical protein
MIVDTPENKDNRPLLVTFTREDAGIGFALWVDQIIVMDPLGAPADLDLVLNEGDTKVGIKTIFATIPATWKAILESDSEIEARTLKEQVAKAERREKIYEQIRKAVQEQAPLGAVYLSGFIDAWDMAQGPNGLDRIASMWVDSSNHTLVCVWENPGA